MGIVVVLGNRYRDSITGFEGVAVARTEYLYGCARVGLQGPASGGKVPDSQWFDELQLTDGLPDPTKGGPRPDPPER